jgi:DNA repair protein RadC
MKIKDSNTLLPREKLIRFGVSSLSDFELLAIIFGTGIKKENVLDFSYRLLSESGNLSSFFSKSIFDLNKINGIGMSKATKIASICEISKRIHSQKTKTIHIKNANDVFVSFKHLFEFEMQEKLVIISLSTKNNVISEKCIFLGTLNEITLHPREIFNEVIKNHANSFILIHNHPSGDPSPSKEDIEFTKKIFDMSILLGIELLDHLVISAGCFYSFKEKNII